MSITTAPTSAHDEALAPNAYRLLWAGFMAILAAGIPPRLRWPRITERYWLVGPPELGGHQHLRSADVD